MISVETDIRPISLTPIVAKVFEYIVLGWVDDIVGAMIDNNQFGGVGGTSNTDALAEMTLKWYEATDVLNNYVRVVLLDFSNAHRRTGRGGRGGSCPPPNSGSLST